MKPKYAHLRFLHADLSVIDTHERPECLAEEEVLGSGVQYYGSSVYVRAYNDESNDSCLNLKRKEEKTGSEPLKQVYFVSYFDSLSYSST